MGWRSTELCVCGVRRSRREQDAPTVVVSFIIVTDHCNCLESLLRLSRLGMNVIRTAKMERNRQVGST